MEPFYFGAPGRELLGIYHPPASVPRAEGVVLCPPLFGEYMRSHGCLRRLALTLAEDGRHVLRFDYYGTGDSSGHFESTTPEDWLADIGEAISELTAISGARRVALVGARLGATLAARASVARGGIARLVLWDPVVHGGRYLEQLRDTHRNLLESHDQLRPTGAGAGDTELTGFRASSALLAGLAELTLPSWSDILEATNGSAAVVLSAEEFGYEEMREGAQQQGVPVDGVPFDCNWATFREAALYPHEIIKAIADRFR